MKLQARSYKLEATRGYTLVEAIIYIAILAMLVVVFIQLLFSLTRSYASFRLARDLVSSSGAALDRMISEIRRAESIDVSSTLGVSPGHLVLNTTDEGGEATTVDFYLSNNALMVEEGGGSVASTTSARVTVDNLVFRQITTAESSAVKVELTLSAARGAVTRTAKFYTTAVLRGSY